MTNTWSLLGASFADAIQNVGGLFGAIKNIGGLFNGGKKDSNQGENSNEDGNSTENGGPRTSISTDNGGPRTPISNSAVGNLRVRDGLGQNLTATSHNDRIKPQLDTTIH